MTDGLVDRTPTWSPPRSVPADTDPDPETDADTDTDTTADAPSLLPLALSQPLQALAIARALVARTSDPAALSYAHQAAGIVLRDAGEVAAALRELRTALRSARTTGSAPRVGDVLATYGATLVLAGRSEEGLRELDAAVGLTHGVVLARVRLRRAHVLETLGRHDEALADLRLAIKSARGCGDVLWEARGLNNRCRVHLALGHLRHAEADAERAERLFAALGQDLESVHAAHNLALVQLGRGHLPAALAHLEAAGERYRRLGAATADLEIDRVRALLAAGLAGEAVVVMERTLAEAVVHPTKRAELLLSAATAAQAAGQAGTAQVWAARAARSFARQRRPWWAARARLVELQARYDGGRVDRRLLQTTAALARTLDQLKLEEAPLAHLLAGRVALGCDDTEQALAAFAAAARHRRSGPPLNRASGWLAAATAASVTGRSRDVLRACGRGLDALDEHRLLYGAELRAYASQHGRELARLALVESLRRGRSRDLLAWSERWRSTALDVPPVHPAEDAALTSDLAAYRDVVRRLASARGTGADTRTLQRERDHWEDAVRRHWRHEQVTGATDAGLDLTELLDSLGSTRLISLVEVDGMLHAVTAHRHRVRGRLVGTAAEVRRELDFARYALRRAATGRPADLGPVGAHLQRVLLGDAAQTCGDEPVVLVPPSSLHHVPWGLLPGLAGLPLTVAPSAASWLRARRRLPPPDPAVALVAAPGLSTGDAEVVALAPLHDHPRTLAGAAATVPNALALLDGAWLGHIAAHGHFRSDSPLFSCLDLADGPLTIYDFDRLERPPHLVLLSACDSAVAAPVGSDEMLGLVTSLLGLGVAGVLASVLPVNDAATVPVMLAVHRALRAGADLPEALRAARHAMSGDPVGAATAASFTAWGC